MLPCRRFADVLADACARLGADVGRYSFIAVDFHHILLAGLPAHSLALRPAHSRSHLYVTSYTEGFSHFVTSMTAPVASGWSDLAGWGSHPLESAALSRRTREADIVDGGGTPRVGRKRTTFAPDFYTTDNKDRPGEACRQLTRWRLSRRDRVLAPRFGSPQEAYLTSDGTHRMLSHALGAWSGS